VQTCFVIMPFGTLFDKYDERVYSRAIVAAGLEPQRADEIFTPGPFMRDVVLGINSVRRGRFGCAGSASAAKVVPSSVEQDRRLDCCQELLVK